MQMRNDCRQYVCIFVFLLIFSSGISHNYQHKILMTGIPGTISMRIALILDGVSLLESFHWMTCIFDGLLVLSWLKMLLQHLDDLLYALYAFMALLNLTLIDI